MKPIYSFEGIVQEGAKRGKNLGFPTANIPLEQKIPEGIYAALVSIHDKAAKQSTAWYSATFIGSAIHFGKIDYKAESHLLEFSGNLYGKLVSVQLFKKLRGNAKFESEKELVKQMEKDVEKVRKYFSTK